MDAIRNYSGWSWLEYFGASLVGSVIISLWVIVPVAAHETDLPIFVSVFMYYAKAIPAYLAAYLVFERFNRKVLVLKAVGFLLGWVSIVVLQLS